MRESSRNLAAEPSGLVIAAREGDERALGELLAAHLPLVYNIVRRALSGHADVDDVVQEVMLRVVRDLPALREPGSFRAWLLAITFHQISSYRHNRRRVEPPTALDEAEEAAPGPDIQDLALLRLDLSGQRRQVVEASRWLDPDNRALMALWWQENAGILTRAEVAAAAGLTVAHAGVRLQRMREQVELGRRIAAALSARPGCAALGAVLAGWDGRRTPLWRKRIGRHIQDCSACSRSASEHIALERLLFTFAALPVPLGVTAALATKGLWASSAVHMSVIGKLAQAVAAHPIAAVTTGAVLVAAPAVTYATWPEAKPKAPVVIVATPPARPSPLPSSARATPSAKPSPARSAATAGIALGSWSLEAAGTPGQFVTYATLYAAVSSVTEVSSEATRQRATFTVVRGLADGRCYTFRAADGRYLRHYYLRLRLSADDGTQLFREDATFCVQPGPVPGSVRLHSHNYPGSALRVRDGGIFLDGDNGTKEYARDSSFIRHEPWAS